MRDFVLLTTMMSSGTWFSLGFYYADRGMLMLSVLFGILTIGLKVLFVIRDHSVIVNDLPTYECTRYGEEFFLKGEDGVMRPSTRIEVSSLLDQGRITDWK